MVLVLVLGAVGVGAFVMLSGDDDEDGGGGAVAAGGGGGDAGAGDLGGSPQEVATAYFMSMATGDCPTMTAVMDLDRLGVSEDQMMAGCVEWTSTDATAPHAPTELVSTSVSNETPQEVTVGIEFVTRAGDSRSAAVVLVGGEGSWRVDGARSYDGGEAPEALSPMEEPLPPPGSPPMP